MLTERLKEKFAYNEPIFTKEILSVMGDYSRAYVFRFIDRAMQSGKLARFDEGVYYLPQRTVLGLSTITAEDVIVKKYIGNRGDVYGIYSVLKLQNIFSVTTQMPNVIEVVSNNETMRARTITLDGMKFILRASRCKIKADNASEYMIMQLFNDIQGEMNDRAKQRVTSYINQKGVKIERLLEIAKSFPAKATKNMIMSGVLYEIA